ncbi:MULTISPECIES: hypothetical protein [unclassified Methylobacterium]|uniref:hypothetical protein n=1 Tax=unclassified Methylobacterium TaxID=2615210 RepID=UPI00226A136A|nr:MULTISPECIES: hypothetical protein [unclassified Methylobacterium]
MHFGMPHEEVADDLDEDFALMPTPGSAIADAAALRRVEASAAAAAERRTDAERKRDERTARREAKRPDPRAVDVALGQALAQVLRDADAAALIAKSGTVKGMRVAVQPILEIALTTLRDKGVPRQIAARVLQARLFPVKGA